MTTRGAASVPRWAYPDVLCVGPHLSAGCVSCARRRRSRVDPRAAVEVDPSEVDVAISEDLLETVARDLDGTRLTWAEIERETLAVTYVVALPQPDCSCTGTAVRLDRPASEGPDLSGARGSRRSAAADLLPALRAAYLDPHAGLVTEVTAMYRDGVVAASAAYPAPSRSGVERGAGFDSDPSAAQAVAILEAVERRAGERPWEFTPSVYGSWREVGPRAVDPRRFGLHDPTMGDRHRYPVGDVVADIRLEWVWAWSLARSTAVLVPAGLAFMEPSDTAAGEGAERLAYEASNGCAIGGSLAEACLAGLFEVVERDAFLMTWYRRLQLPRLATTTMPVGLQERIAAIGSRLQMQVDVFDATMEHGIPAAIAVARGRRAEDVSAVCTAGAGVDLSDAIARALHELAPFIHANRERFDELRPVVEGMLDDPLQVTALEHHPLLVCHPRGAARLDFLTRGPLVAFEESPGSGRPVGATDPLSEVVGRLASTADDVIVVAQTTDEHRVIGLEVVKMLVPQLLPMTFGHARRRTTGLPRLWEVPRRLGLTGSPVLNPHPHPFG